VQKGAGATFESSTRSSRGCNVERRCLSRIVTIRSKAKGYRDCHIEPDWVLIYKLTDDELRLARTGTHTDLFDN